MNKRVTFWAVMCRDGKRFHASLEGGTFIEYSSADARYSRPTADLESCGPHEVVRLTGVRKERK